MRKVTCTAEGISGGRSLCKIIRTEKVHHKDKMLDLELQDLVFQLIVCQPFLVILLSVLEWNSLFCASVWEIFSVNFDFAKDNI